MAGFQTGHIKKLVAYGSITMSPHPNLPPQKGEGEIKQPYMR
jgi:hypothetical protein